MRRQRVVEARRAAVETALLHASVDDRVAPDMTGWGDRVVTTSAASDAAAAADVSPRADLSSRARRRLPW